MMVLVSPRCHTGRNALLLAPTNRLCPAGLQYWELMLANRVLPLLGDGARATFRIFRAAFHRPLGHKDRAAPSQVCLPPEPREVQGFRSCGRHRISASS